MATGWLVAFAVIGVLVAVASGILVARFKECREVWAVYWHGAASTHPFTA
jgi:hypothetical protein